MEYAELMARRAEALIDAIMQEDDALQAFDHAEAGLSKNLSGVVVGDATRTRIEHMDSLKEMIFEYRRRAARVESYTPTDPLELAMMFSETYQRLAPEFGYETPYVTKHFDADTPQGRLLIETCKEVSALQRTKYGRK